jgi:hypothetical protein
MKYALLGLLALAGLYALHRLGLWAEQRGWIYYRTKHGSSGTLANAALEVHSLFDPSTRYVVEERERDQVEDDQSGDPPTTRRSSADGPADAAGEVQGGTRTAQ